ncbi:DUF1552 domain-containing protein, partial [bacterium]|nr:DUF1552 domain-containing protein [bacterium]
MVNRRNILQGMAAGVALSSTSLGQRSNTEVRSGRPKRVVFFLQNQGFDPETCVPAGMKASSSLAGVELPEPISPLEPYKNKLHIITGLHGR